MITHRVGWHELPEIYGRMDKGESELLGVVVRW